LGILIKDLYVREEGQEVHYVGEHLELVGIIFRGVRGAGELCSKVGEFL